MQQRGALLETVQELLSASRRKRKLTAAHLSGSARRRSGNDLSSSIPLPTPQQDNQMIQLL